MSAHVLSPERITVAVVLALALVVLVERIARELADLSPVAKAYRSDRELAERRQLDTDRIGRHPREPMWDEPAVDNPVIERLIAQTKTLPNA